MLMLTTAADRIDARLKTGDRPSFFQQPDLKPPLRPPYQYERLLIPSQQTYKSSP
jgi:hypothetical protein